VPDLDDQLRHCLHRHAEGVTAAPGLSIAARVRSQRMGRTSHALTALAVVPVTAGVVAGGVALASPAHHRQQSRVTAANTPSAKPSPTAAPQTITYRECPQGTSPKLKALDGGLTVHVGHHAALQDILTRRVHLKNTDGALPKAIYSMHVIAHRSNGRAVIAFERAPLNGKVKWTIAVRKSPTDFVSHRAKLLGCVSTSR
jgi:hypothetical protein